MTKLETDSAVGDVDKMWFPSTQAETYALKRLLREAPVITADARTTSSPVSSRILYDTKQAGFLFLMLLLLCRELSSVALHSNTGCMSI